MIGKRRVSAAFFWFIKVLYIMGSGGQHLNTDLESTQILQNDIPWFTGCDMNTAHAPYLSDAFAWEADLREQTLRIFGFSGESVCGMPLAKYLKYVCPDDATRIESFLATQNIGEPQSLDFHLRVRAKNAQRRYRVRGRVFASGEAVFAAGVAFDTDCSETYLKRLDYLETHDELTGLYNAHTLDGFYEAALEKGMLPQTLIVSSIDGLKEFNETMGYHAGSTLIKSVADVLGECFFDADIIARVGGGDFCAAFFGKERSEIEHRIGEATMQLHKTYLNLVKAHVTFGFASSEEKADFSTMYSKALAHMKKNGSIKKVLSEPCVIDPLNELIAQRTGWGKRVTRIGSLATQVGTAMGCDEEQLSEIRVLSRIVDLGLIGIDARLLKNRTQLSGRDRQEYMRHIEIGRGIITSIDTLAFLEPLYLQVYQRYEGQQDTALPSKVLAVVIAFDDIAFERGSDQIAGIMSWLRRQKARYCPEVVEAMMAVTAGRPM